MPLGLRERFWGIDRRAGFIFLALALLAVAGFMFPGDRSPPPVERGGVSSASAGVSIANVSVSAPGAEEGAGGVVSEKEEDVSQSSGAWGSVEVGRNTGRGEGFRLTVCPSGCGYASIQDGVNAVRSGGVVEVRGGVYRENVRVSKSLALVGIGGPLVDALGRDSGITVLADGVEVRGFRVVNSSDGEAGIKLLSNGNTIRENSVSGSYYGILLYGSSRNTLEGNVLTGNRGDGILLTSSSTGNLLEGNTVSNNKNGIKLKTYSTGNTVKNNNASFNSWSTGAGGHGIYITSNSTGNLLYQNELTGNSHGDARDTAGGNRWDNGTVGNHYSDHDEPSEGCEDDNGNGICDTSYPIPGREDGPSLDNYPVFKSDLYTPSPSPAPFVTVCPAGCDYTSIQDAVDNSTAGDTILVRSGTYQGVEVGEELADIVLRGGGTPLVRGDGESVVEIRGDNVIFEGFKVTGTGNTCIRVEADNATLKNNSVSQCNYGIYLYRSNHSTLENNTVEDNNKDGIKLFKSDHNNLTGNRADRNKNGIHLDTSRNNTLTGNMARYNRWHTGAGGHGIYITSNSRDNLLYLNNLIDNNQTDAKDTAGGNRWDNGNVGNHYSDNRGCSDTDLNGICDSPYPIPGGSSRDRYPIAGAPVETATGRGVVYIGCPGCTEVKDLVAVLPPENPPVNLPYGLFSFNLTVPRGGTVTVTLLFPQNLPVGASYWKYQDGSWQGIPVGDNDGDNVITLNLTDGGTGDGDQRPNGVIEDPGGPSPPRPLLPVPELSSLLLTALGLGGLAVLLGKTG